jgi:predicted transcriptional regulator
VAQTENILISVEYDHVLNMLNGRKTAELRRRPVRIKPGTKVWIYSKMPRGRVELVATADSIVASSPQDLWNRYKTRVAINSSDFETYFAGVDIGCAILLRDIRALRPALGLTMLRQTSRRFQPPQFFKRLNSQSPELRCLLSCAALAPDSLSVKRAHLSSSAALVPART